MISVIIPVYNVESYILDCLKSIDEAITFAEAKDKVEIIIINDGSEDNSHQLIESFLTDKNSNFSYYQQRNQGVAMTRNRGIRIAEKLYVTFIDPDDYIRKDYFSILLEEIKKETYDAIFFDLERVSFDKVEKLGTFRGMDNTDFSSKWYANGSLQCKLVRREIIQQFECTSGLIYEDAELIYKFLGMIESYNYIQEGIYFYRIGRKNSITSTRNNNIDDIFIILDSIYNYYKTKGTLNQNFEGLEYQFVKILLWSNVYRQLKYSGFNFFAGNKRVIKTKSYLIEKFPNWFDNSLVLNSLYFRELMGAHFIEKFKLLGKNTILTYGIILSNRLINR